MAEERLSEKQEMAIELVLTGMSDGEIATQVKVSRQWVNKWRNQNSVFIDALEERRRVLRERQRDSINGLVEKAIAVLAEAMDGDDIKARMAAARLVLDLAGLKEHAKQEKGASDGEQLLKQLAEAFGVVSKELGYPNPAGGRRELTK